MKPDTQKSKSTASVGSATGTTGILLATLAERLSLAEVSDPAVLAAHHAPAFFAWLGAWGPRAQEDEQPTTRRRRPHGTGEIGVLPDAIDLSWQRGPRAGPQSAILEHVDLLLFPVRRRPGSELRFVSIGRLVGNDIAVCDDTISKFHAYVKPDDTGALVLLQDGRSRNGTFVDGARVARRGEGEPTRLSSGQHVRIGSVAMSFLDAAAVLRLAQQRMGGPRRPPLPRQPHSVGR